MHERKSYGGIYRGVCVDNQDPLGLSRIRVRIPQVLGSATSGWAERCVPPGWSAAGGALLQTHTGHDNHTFTDYNDGTGSTGNKAVSLPHTHNHDQHQLIQKTPATGESLWVMFEGGDPDFPVWIGVH